jgi:hypothetical protein
MAKITIPLGTLPPPNDDGSHILRFRIGSIDNNSKSRYSKLFKVLSIGQISPSTVAPRFIALTASGPFTVEWDSNITIPALPSTANLSSELYDQSFDIFIDRNGTGLQYYSRVNSNSVLINEGATTTLRVVGQLPVHPLPTSVLNNFKKFDTGVMTL